MRIPISSCVCAIRVEDMVRLDGMVGSRCMAATVTATPVPAECDDSGASNGSDAGTDVRSRGCVGTSDMGKGGICGSGRRNMAGWSDVS